jgi:hypothetical protein
MNWLVYSWLAATASLQEIVSIEPNGDKADF